MQRLSASLRNSEIWLLGILGSLIGIYLTLIWRSDDPTNLYINFLFLITIYFTLKDRHYRLNLESGALSSFLGTLLISLIFIYSFFKIHISFLSFFSPLLSGLGLALIASGYKGLKQYRKELLILCSLTIRNLLIVYKPDITLLTAKLSTAILWYTGFDVKRSGLIINLPKGSVEVYAGCSGMDVIIDVLSLAVLFIFMFDIKMVQKIITPIIAVIIGFVVNGFRVALMGVLVAEGNKQAFDYWHEGDGSLIFAMIASLILCCFCWLLLSLNEREAKSNTN